MKKNISINISGIIFHIEEDGYDKLKNYLDSISQYFSGFDDSKEIISDIESRIAEIFLSKLTEEKQVITADDVETLIATMGSIKDFQAIEDSGEENTGSEKQQSTYTEDHAHNAPPKELKRDNSRKLLGGVCAGIAAYFSIDPIWIRLIAIILTLGSSGIIAIAYIVMWAVLPTSNNFDENPKTKKMYRNPEDKVLAGVAGGIAAYFGVDVSVVRVLFVIFTFFGGTGLLAYLIMWIILPEANSITDKVQMKGEPVTLSNIETNVKKSLNVKEEEEENLLVKVLLFPFRLIATVINGLSGAFGPFIKFLVDFIRVVVGIILAMIGISFALATLTIIGAITGIVTGGTLLHMPYEHFSQPVFMFVESIPSLSIAFAFIVAIIPAILFILLGVSIISKRVVFNAATGWSLFGLFIVGAIVLSISVPGIVYSYHEESHHEETKTFSIDHPAFVLKADRSKGIDDYEVTDVFLKGYTGNEIKTVMDFSSRGISREDAIRNAEMVEYNILKEDSSLIFDYNISFSENANFKFQELDVTVYIPYNQPFYIDRSMRNLLTYRSIDRYGYRKSQVDMDNKWIFTSSGLECVTCDKHSDGWSSSSNNNYKKIIELADFNMITIGSAITVEIKQGDEYKIEVSGEDDYIEQVSVVKEEEEIIIHFDEDLTDARNFNRSRNDLKVTISLPDLLSLELNQASQTKIRGFEANTLELEMNGAADAEIDADIQQIDINLNGSSRLKLTGKGNEIRVVANGASDLDAYSFRSKLADVSAHGASTVRLYVSDTISINRDIVSSVRYRGGATENSN